jgi:hypothetical protein
MCIKWWSLHILSTKQTAEMLAKKYTTKSINNFSLNHRSLIKKNKRVILPNVCPIIPNAVIQERLANLGIKTTFQISHLREWIPDPRYMNTLSFRRQIYIRPVDFGEIPASLQISSEVNNCWIYLTSVAPKCFLCKTEDNSARQCSLTPKT